MGMQVENLNEQNMQELEEKIKLLEEKSPEVTHKTFPMTDLDIIKQIEELKLKIGSVRELVDAQILLFKKTFGGYVLIHGKWVNPNIPE